MSRYAQCDGTCTTDCGHCKGEGPPVVTAPSSRTGATDREVEARCTEDHCDQLCDQAMSDRDRYHEVADQLASLLAPPEVLGEHSSMNDPWQNAIDHAEAQAANAARAAAAPTSGQLRERAMFWLYHHTGLNEDDLGAHADDLLAALLAEQPGGGK